MATATSNPPTGFNLPETALNTLIKGQATALDLAGLLVTARFSDGDDVSTAGANALSKYIGVGVAAAELTQQRLTQYGVIAPIKRSKAPAPCERARARWRIVCDHRKGDVKRVWFSAQLVDGYGKFTQPLRRLKGLGDVAARLLVMMHRRVDWATYTALPPYPNVYGKYLTTPQVTADGMDLYTATADQSLAYDDIILPALGLKERIRDDAKWKEALPPFWTALRLLEESGFIYTTATVLDASPETPGCTPLYCLHTTNKHGYTPEGEDGLAGDLARLAGKLGYPVTGEGGRFSGNYAVLVQHGQPCHVAGLYRLRFRADAYRRDLRDGWKALRAANDEWRERIRAMEKAP